MNNIIDEILSLVRTTFARITWKKVLIFFFFIVLAAVLWFLQIYRQQFETTLEIPVRYVNVPDSIVFDNEPPEMVSIKVKDGGAEMFRYFFSKRKDTLVIDVRQIINSNKSNILQGASLEEILRTKMLSSSELRSYSPARISLDHAILKSKKLPVVFDGVVQLDPGFLLVEDIKVIPDSVIAYGSEATLADLDFAYTLSDTIKGLEEASIIVVHLKKSKNIRFAPSSVELQIPVDQYMPQTVQVPVICINLPENMDIKIFPSTVAVSFVVGMTQSKDISEDDFLIELDYNDLKDFETMTVPVRLTSSPPYIDNIVISPSEVEFVFEVNQ